MLKLDLLFLLVEVGFLWILKLHRSVLRFYLLVMIIKFRARLLSPLNLLIFLPILIIYLIILPITFLLLQVVIKIINILLVIIIHLLLIAYAH